MSGRNEVKFSASPASSLMTVDRNSDGWLWLSWTLANGICVATVIWLGVLLSDRISPEQLLFIPLLLLAGFLATSLIQQLLLWKQEMRAMLWWLTSCLGWGLGAVAGMLTEDALLWLIRSADVQAPFDFEIASPIAAIVFGLIFGTNQMLACKELRSRPIVWPLASAAGIFAAVIVFRLHLLYGTNAVWVYLISLVSGAAYGAVTGAALIRVKRAMRGRTDSIK